VTELESALRETRAIAARRRELRTEIRAALRRGDDATVVRLAAQLVEGDDAESDRTAPRQHGRPGGV
jgi:hypothetical protein